MSSDTEQDIRIASLERRVAALEAHLDVHAPGPDAAVSPDVIAQLQAGNMIGAIKAIREIEGLDLAQAKTRAAQISATL